MDKKAWATTLAVPLSIATLGIAVTYLKVSSERIPATESPSGVTEEFEGPVYTGTDIVAQGNIARRSGRSSEHGKHYNNYGSGRTQFQPTLDESERCEKAQFSLNITER